LSRVFVRDCVRSHLFDWRIIYTPLEYDAPGTR